MRRQTYRKESHLRVSPETVFRWHTRAGAFERLVPPWQEVEIRSGGDRLAEGARLELAVRVGPMKMRWDAKITHFEPNVKFVDVQTKGPFKFWQHTHGMEGLGNGGTLLVDSVEYAAPFGWVGRLLAGGKIRSDLIRLFAYRHDITRHDLESQGETSAMKILITGASGLVGSHLSALLKSQGHTVRAAVRRAKTSPEEVAWNPDTGFSEPSDLEGLDAVIHLAGENIASGRWTAKRKAAIRESRIEGTRRLVSALVGLRHPPRVLVCASAIGFYGNRGDELLHEGSAAGNDFLAEVCQAWEGASKPAADAGMRVVSLRLGVVLSPRGGALRKMLLPFRLGGGGRVGNGKQFMSFISIEDAARAIVHCLEKESLQGPVNAVSPEAVTNLEFTKTLGRVLRRPTFLPMPAFVARVVFGELADALLLASTRVAPRRLVASGFEFRHPDLEQALRDLLGRPKP